MLGKGSTCCAALETEGKESIHINQGIIPMAAEDLMRIASDAERESVEGTDYQVRCHVHRIYFN